MRIYLRLAPPLSRRNHPVHAALSKSRAQVDVARVVPCLHGGLSEVFVEFLRARMEKRRYSLIVNDPQPLGSVTALWRLIAPGATVGIFILAALAALSAGRSLLMPVAAALIISLTLAPLVRWASQHGVPSWLSGPLLVLILIAATAAAITVMAAPVGEWIARAPEIAETVRSKLYVLDQPLAALHTLRESMLSKGATAVKVDPGTSNLLVPLMTYLTPALGELIIFVGVLTFALIGQVEFHRRLVTLFTSRDAKLRALRIANDIEHNLSSYLIVVTGINASLGVVVACGAWAFGFPNPIVLGVLAAVLNYVPYIGPAAMAIILFAVGLVSFPTLGYALVPPLCFVGLATLEGQFITPAIMGRRLTLSPLTVFLSLAFWTWLWGPFGAFLAVPLSIVALVTINHLVPQNGALPD
jgi:predicted PurR-regulated permease PerM